MHYVIALAACRSEPEPVVHDKDPETEPHTDPSSSPDPDDADGDGYPAATDCDDADASVYPGALEICGDDRITDCESDRGNDDGLVTVDGVSSYTDLGEALAAAVDGSEVRVCAGIWTGPFVAPVAVRLVGHAGAATTTLDGAAAGTTLSVPGGSTIEGFTIVGGATDGDGGGIALVSSGPLTVADCAIHDNQALRGGGLALAPGSPVTVSGTTVGHNHAWHGGGIFAPAGASVDLTGSTVRDNQATQAGGGLALEDAALIGGTVDDNTAEGDDYFGVPKGGGGLSALGSSTVTGTDVGTNAGAPGGGISAQEGELVLVDVDVHDNIAIPYADGGGIWGEYVDIDLRYATEIRGNEADLGGGISISYGALSGGLVTGNTGYLGGGIFSQGSSIAEVSVIANLGVSNPYGDGYGGGLALMGANELVEVVAEGNTAERGGGIALFSDLGTSLTITGGRVAGNTATAWGGGLYLPSSTSIEGTQIEDNVADWGAGGLYLLGWGLYGTFSVTDATILRNQAPDGSGALLVGGAVLASETSDWGVGADDNAPTDVNDLVGYGAAASFTCDATGCTPEP